MVDSFEFNWLAGSGPILQQPLIVQRCMIKSIQNFATFIIETTKAFSATRVKNWKPERAIWKNATPSQHLAETYFIQALIFFHCPKCINQD